MSILYPDVPIAPGVPSVARLAGVATAQVAALTADTVSTQNADPTPQWGIFLSGSNAFSGTSVIGSQIQKGFKVASHPVEEGGFASYNKIAVPYDARVTLLCDGSDSSGQPTGALANRAAFVAALDAAIASLTLYSVVMPEFQWASANIVHYDINRKSMAGMSMVPVDIMLKEIRQTASEGFTNTSDPDGADAVNGGQPQPQAMTPSTTPPAVDDGTS